MSWNNKIIKLIYDNPSDNKSNQLVYTRNNPTKISIHDIYYNKYKNLRTYLIFKSTRT